MTAIANLTERIAATIRDLEDAQDSHGADSAPARRLESQLTHLQSQRSELEEQRENQHHVCEFINAHHPSTAVPAEDPSYVMATCVFSDGTAETERVFATVGAARRWLGY